MQILFEELRDVLQDELKLYEEMYNLTVKKTDVIINGKISDLDNITHLENSIILKLGQLETRREKVVINIQEQLGVKKDSTISDILNYIDDKDEIKQELDSITKKLLDVLNSIKERNDLNGLLIKDTLEYIELNINLLTSATDKGIYNNKIQKEQSSQNISLFDTKA